MKKSNLRHIFLKTILYFLLICVFSLLCLLLTNSYIVFNFLSSVFDNIIIYNNFGIFNVLSIILAVFFITVFLLPLVFLAQIVYGLNFHEKRIGESFWLPVKSVVNRWLAWIRSHSLFLCKVVIIEIAVYLNFLALNSSLGISIANILIINFLAILLMIACVSRKN